MPFSRGYIDNAFFEGAVLMSFFVGAFLIMSFLREPFDNAFFWGRNFDKYFRCMLIEWLLICHKAKLFTTSNWSKYLSCLNRACYWISSLWNVVWFKQTVGSELCFELHAACSPGSFKTDLSAPG